MIERKQESATKRQRILREQEERRMRHENGDESPDENAGIAGRKFVGGKLLMQ